MGTFTLGRLTLGSENAPDRWEVNGDRIKFGADIRGATIAETQFRRLQAIGLLDNPDVSVFPMTWSEDAVLWDTFVRIIDVKVGTVAASLNGAGWFPAEFEVEMIADSANAPVVESRLLGALRTNSHSVTNGTTEPWWSSPSDFYNLAFTPSAPSSGARTGAESTHTVYYTADGTGLYDTTVQFQVAPGNAYKASARIELSGDSGTTYYPVVGRQVANLPTAWRLANDLVRVTPSFGAGTFLLDVSHFDGTVWDTAKRFKLTTGIGPSSVVGDPDSIVILHNSPEWCSLRLTASAVVGNAFTVDLNLRRGARHVECYLAARQAGQVGIYANTVEAVTAHTTGVHATVADVPGNRFILTTPNAKTNDLTNGGFYMTASNATFQFMIASEVPSATAAPNDYASVVNQYLAAVNETQRVVQR